MLALPGLESRWAGDVVAGKGIGMGVANWVGVTAVVVIVRLSFRFGIGKLGRGRRGTPGGGRARTGAPGGDDTLVLAAGIIAGGCKIGPLEIHCNISSNDE